MYEFSCAPHLPAVFALSDLTRVVLRVTNPRHLARASAVAAASSQEGRLRSNL